MDFVDLHHHLLPLVVIGGAFGFAGTILYGAWLLGRYRGRDERLPASLVDLETRIDRLEQAVGQATDAVDRLEAAHRLTARLLTDRVSDRQGGENARPPHRATTPH